MPEKMTSSKNNNRKPVFEHDGREYYYSDILSALKKAGIKKSDTIFVHADVSKFGKLSGFKNRNEFLCVMSNSLKASVGESGTIIMPTFTYSFTKNEIYDPQRTASTVGVLTEYFRKQKDTLRTTHPIFSVALWGKRKGYFSSDLSKDCFGQGSIFEKAHKKNAKIFFFGAPFQSCTFVHYMEQLFNVPYRFYKTFTGKIKLRGKLYEDKYGYFVKYLNKNVKLDLTRFKNYLLENKLIKKVNLGHAEILQICSDRLVEEGMKVLKKDTYFFLREKPRGME